MDIIKFTQRFPDEEVCRLYFKSFREKSGIKCKKCGGTSHYWHKPKWQWECKQCSFRTTLRSGTMMENSNLPLRIWFLAMALMTFSKKGISACEMQRQLNHSRYDTIWSLMHRIRNVMGNRDIELLMAGMKQAVEPDYMLPSPDKVKLKRRKLLSKLPGGNSRINNKDISINPIFWFRSRIICSDDIGEIDERELLFTDRAVAFNRMMLYIETLRMKFQNFESEECKIEKWKSIFSFNACRSILGVYHKVKGKYLQLYLDEFCYKFNRRHIRNQIFDNMIIDLIAWD
jgi:hypothetical protein